MLVLSLCHFNELRQLVSIALCWTVYVPISTTWAVFVGFWIVVPPCLSSKRVHIKIFTQRVVCTALSFLRYSMVWGSVTLTPCIVQRIEHLTYPKCFEIFRWLLGAEHKEKLFKFKFFWQPLAPHKWLVWRAERVLTANMCFCWNVFANVNNLCLPVAPGTVTWGLHATWRMLPSQRLIHVNLWLILLCSHVSHAIKEKGNSFTLGQHSENVNVWSLEAEGKKNQWKIGGKFRKGELNDRVFFPTSLSLNFFTATLFFFFNAEYVFQVA